MVEMKVLLVDSDQRLRGELAVMLHAFQCFRIAGTAQNTEEAVEYIQSNDVDVIFVNHQPLINSISRMRTKNRVIFLNLI